MAGPNDRMRLKDKIIDNISKAIKSIQELHYYQQKDPVLTKSADTVTLCNGDRPCHKLCENVDHALLHGLKNVTHGYWRVVKQLSHKGMVREIDLLTNVTTDLGRGRAWLYLSLNEGLLESYIRLIGDNEKLMKKFYAKEALVLDRDRMNLLLTLASGLECAVFQLEYDLPYLDLSAYPPRSRIDSDLDSDLSSTSSVSHLQNFRFRSGSEIVASSPDSTIRLPSDSDSSSLASVDVLSHLDQGHSMRASIISNDSGFTADSVISSFARQRSITPTDTAVNSNPPNGNCTDTVSVSSINSAGEPDRHQRLESIVPVAEDEDEGAGNSLEVIRIKNKKGSKTKKKKRGFQDKTGGDKSNGSVSQVNSRRASEQDDCLSQECDLQVNGATVHNSTGAGNAEVKGKPEAHDQAGVGKSILSVVSAETSPKDGDTVDGSAVGELPKAPIPQFDSGVDIYGLTTSAGQSSPSTGSDTAGSALSNDKHAGDGPLLPQQSALAQIESKIAELCTPDIVDHSSSPGNSKSLNIDSIRSQNGKLTSVGSECGSSSNGSVPQSLAHSVKDVDKKESVSGNSLSTFRDVQSLSARSSIKPNSTSHTLQNLPTTASNASTQVKNYAEQNQSIYSDSTGQTHQSQLEEKNNNDMSYRKQLNYADKHDDDFDVYASHSSDKEVKQDINGSELAGASAEISKAQAASKLQDYMDFILQPANSPPPTPDMQEEPQEEELDYSLSLDNNTKLQVMLDIFIHEDEQFVKMFVTRENHTDGDAGVVFVLISDQCLYLLHYRQATRKFKLQSSAMLADLIFISTGLYDQTLNIESRDKNRQKKRFWITPGHQALTQAILASLTEAVKAVNEQIVSVRSRFSVGSEVPLQKIALRKYISKELNCEAQDVTIEDYSLVHWEDPSTPLQQQSNAAAKEGTLCLRTQDPLKGYVWKPVYVVLKNSMLTISNNKSDPRPHSYLGLGGDQCVGCRLKSMVDRDHCVELVLAHGGSWYLSAASRVEITDWMHQLCLAVSQGTVDDSTMTSCTPCCAVMACNTMFLCHEDLHTKFYRTLGRAQLEDVTAIGIDEEDPTYCIIEFESVEVGVSSEKWAFYFASSQDLDRHKAALSSAWKSIFQIELPILPVDNVALQSQCRGHSDQLKKQLMLR